MSGGRHIAGVKHARGCVCPMCVLPARKGPAAAPAPPPRPAGPGADVRYREARARSGADRRLRRWNELVRSGVDRLEAFRIVDDEFSKQGAP